MPCCLRAVFSNSSNFAQQHMQTINHAAKLGGGAYAQGNRSHVALLQHNSTCTLQTVGLACIMIGRQCGYWQVRSRQGGRGGVECSRGVDHGRGEGRWQASRVSSRARRACAKQRGLAVLGAVEAMRLITTASTKGALAIRIAPHAMLHAMMACQG